MSRVEKLRNKNRVIVHERTREEKEPTSKAKFYIFLIIILLSTLAYLVFFSGIFNLNNINVEGYQNPERIEDLVKEVANDSLIPNNILFINKKYIESIVIGDSRIKSINIKTILPNKLSIEVKESKPEIIWATAGEKFLVDGGGYVTGNYNNENLITVFDGSNIPISLGERVASPTFIKFINDLSDNFEMIVGSKIVKITIFDIMSDVHVLSSNDWTVYLDATKDVKTQLTNLNKVIKEAGDNRSLEYIDMRLDTRIYYK